jgi:hypothetical protein
MSKTKPNALDTLRALIAERQQYDQWISTLESKRDGSPEHVYNRVYADYRSRLDRVLGEIRSHSEELQLSINALTSRLAEVAKEEEAKRDSIQEAELRAAVGEYDEEEWGSMRAEAGRQLDKIAADRASLESQFAELESIRRLSEVSSTAGEASTVAPIVSSPAPVQSAPTPTPVQSVPVPQADSKTEGDSAIGRPRFSDAGWPAREAVETASAPAPAAAPGRPAEPASRSAVDATVSAPRPSASPSPAPPAPTSPPKRRTPSGKDAQISSGFSKSVATPPEGRPEVNKTLKCPECGTPNYPTEWYCERCGHELATM